MAVGQRAQTTRVRATGWLWGGGVGLCVALILAGAYVGRHIVAAREQAAAYVPPPVVASAAVVRELRPEAGAVFAVPVGTSTRMVLVASSAERACPIVGACGPRPPLDRMEVADIASGAVVASQPLTGAAQSALAVAVDAPLGLIDLVTPSAIETFDAVTLAPIATLPLPAGTTADSISGAAIASNGLLWLVARHGGQLDLLGMNERGSLVHADTPLANATSVDGPLNDASERTVLLLERSADGAATLAVFSAADGALERQMPATPGARLGPLDAAADAVYLLAGDGTTERLAVQGAASGASDTAVPALFGARALGWDSAKQQRYLANTTGVRILDARSGATLAGLPVAVESPPQQPLIPVDANGTPLLPILTEHGTLLVIQPTAAPRSVTAGTAALLGRAALAKLAPSFVDDVALQNPPFLATGMFTPGAGTRASVPFMNDDPDVGWKSAVPGTTEVAVANAPGGAYDVTFMATWTVHAFTQRHVAVVRVAPNGSVRLVSDMGDPLP